MKDDLGSEPQHNARRIQGNLRTATDWVLANRSNWLRGLLMLFFFLVLGLVRVVVGFVALVQFGALLITGVPNERLRRFGASLALYSCDLVEYLACVVERPPFPFSEWPHQDAAS